MPPANFLCSLSIPVIMLATYLTLYSLSLPLYNRECSFWMKYRRVNEQNASYSCSTTKQ